MPRRKKEAGSSDVKAKKSKSTGDETEDIIEKTSSDVNGNGMDKKARSFSHWLMKSEPESRMENGIDVKFGIEELKSSPNQTSCWDGVRNYQARNFMRDQMRVGDNVFFYHSNTKEPGIAGVCQVVKESYVDHTQFDSKDPHFDRKAKKEDPRWYMVDVQFVCMMKRYITLKELKALHQKHKGCDGPLKNLALFTKARLSVQPLTQEEWNFVQSLANQDPEEV